MLMAEGQMSDHTGAKHPNSSLSPAETLIADKDSDSDEFHQAPSAQNITAGTPPTRSKSTSISSIGNSTRPGTRSRTYLAG
jgi:hypothetical protein